MIQVVSVSHSYDGTRNVLDGVSFMLERGEQCGLVGPSGSGKSTLARILGGHLRPSSGAVMLDGQSIIGAPTRDVLIIQQDWDLFPWQRVEDQIRFAMREPDETKIQQWIGLMKLSGSEKLFPAQLSGGMKRRLALARALAVSPKLLILDETFGFLDRTMRAEIVADMHEIWRETQTTVLVIAHDLDGLEPLVGRKIQINASCL